MADPFSSIGIEFTGEDTQALDNLFAQPAAQQTDELSAFLDQPSPTLAQAGNLIQLRDNPKANDLLLGTATRFKEGKLPFNTQSWQDAQKNVNDYITSTSQATLDAEKNNDWLGLTKIAVGGIGKVIGSYLQTGLGITNEDAKAMQESLASRNYIGTIKDPVKAAKALELGTLYSDELTAGNSIAPKDQKPAMAFGYGAWNTPKVGMNLARAQEYYQDLQSDKTKKLGTAGLRNFAIQSGDAFVPFVSIGDIVVDENDPDQVARRAALTNGINDVIQKDYLPSTLAGLTTGSLGQFMAVGAGSTSLLGKAANIAGQTIKVPTTLSKGATYAVIGASQSLDQDPRNLSVGQRLASVISEAGVLALAEEAGNKLEDVVDRALVNHMVAKSLESKIPTLAPVVQGTAKVIGTTLGETSSDVIDAISRGQDPIAQIPLSLAASGGIGLGMVLVEGLAGRRAKLNQMANDKFADILRQTVTGIKNDPKIPEDQKIQQIVELRDSLNSPEAQALFDAVNIRASLDPRTAPETTKVADEAIASAKQGAVESMLSAKLTEAEGRIGTPATFETRVPTLKYVDLPGQTRSRNTPLEPNQPIKILPEKTQKFRNVIEKFLNNNPLTGSEIETLIAYAEREGFYVPFERNLDSKEAATDVNSLDPSWVLDVEADTWSKKDATPTNKKLIVYAPNYTKPGDTTADMGRIRYELLPDKSTIDPLNSGATLKFGDLGIKSSVLQMGVPPTVETRAPETDEEAIGAFNELVTVFQKGVTSVDLSSTPNNQAKIDWLESQGRVYGRLSEDGSRYQVLGVKDAEGNWLGQEDPAEIMQDEKLAIFEEIENKPGITQDQIDEVADLLDTAGSMPEIEAIASKYLGPSQIQTALETRLAQQQELVAEERPAEFRAKKIADQIVALQTKIRQSPLEETPALEEQLAKLQAMQGQGELERGARGEQTVASLIRQFEREASAAIKSGAISPELEARPEVILAINNPEQSSYQKFQKLAPDPRENDVNALGDVFNLKNPSTVELLQSIGAIDENGRNMMTPAETLMAYIKRKNAYLQSKSLAGYQTYNIADEVSNGTINSFLYELRQGKNNLSLSTIFNSRLRDFIRQAVPRMRAGVGIGAAVSMETPGLRTQAVDAETLAEEQGLNPAVAGAINETLDQIDATETDFQTQGQTEVPSAAQRQESLAVLAENLKQPFRNSLATDAEKLAFDSVVGDVKNVASEAARIGTTIDNINALQAAVKIKFIQGLENDYRRNQRAGTLPARPVEEPAGVVREGNLTASQIKPYVDRFRQLQSDNFFDDAELVAAKTLLGEVQSSRSGDLLRSFDNFIESVSASKLTPDSITELTEAIDTNLKQSTEDGTISQKQADDYIATLNKLAEPYLASETMPEGEAKNKIAAAFRSNLLRVSDQILRDSGLTMNEEGTYEQPTAPRPETKTPVDRREEARAKLAELEAKRATAAKRVPEKAVPAERKEMERPAERPPAGAGRPGVERTRGTPIPKSFVEPRNQLGKPFNEKILAPLGQQVLSNLSKEQIQDVAAAVTTIENSKHKAFYLANGPGAGKTRVVLGTGGYYLNKGFKVVYLTAPDAVTPNWDYGEIGGSIQKDAAILGIPLAVRGGKGENGKGLPIEFVPGRMLVTTYNSGYLEKLLPLIDDKTVVLMDEQHSGRNLSKAIQGGKTRSWAILMDDIANKAGRTLMASGTPFETPDQLLSLGRLGIFDNESPEALFSRLGFQKYSLRGGKKYYWQLAEGVTETEMQDRLETYLDGMAKNGIMRSRSLRLDGVNVEFQDVPLDNQIKQQLEDIKAMYGGTQNVDISALRKMAAAQKRALEEYKVDAAAKRAVDAIKRGKKPVLYVGFVSDENSKGETVNPTSALLEAAIAKLDPTLKIARMYTGSEQTKEQAMAAFNEGEADVLIATKEMGGTGIELDDKFGDESREMIILSPPISAIQAVQLIYRVWRVDSASRPNIVFLESQAEIDQNTIGRMRAKLRLLDATVGAGFEGLRAEQVVAPVREANEATPEQQKFVDAELTSVLGANYKDNTITFKDAKGQPRTYNVLVSPTAEHGVAAQAGTDNESDTIIINPEKLAVSKSRISPKDFKSYLTKVMLEETIHVETYRYFRELGLDPVEELTAIGDGMSQATRLAIARLYNSSLGSDITNPVIQGKIKALANDSFLTAMEGIRQLSQLNLAGGITEQVSSVNANDIARATQRLKDLVGQEPKSVLARLGVWFDSMATVVKRGLGLAPQATDRLVLRQGIEDAISNLRKTSKYFVEASAPGPVPAPEPGRSPTSPRPANKFDSYDLRVYRMIENHLEGRTDGVFGVTAADDLFKTVDVNDWLDGLDVAARRGMITNQERNLFRSATKSVMDGGRASLPGIANKALEIAEGMEESGESLPVAAFVATTEPVNLTEPFEYGKYNVKIGFYPSYPTTAKTAAGAVANTVAKMFEDRNEIIFDGRNYTYKNRGALIAAIGRAGYDNYARRLTPSVEILTEKPIVNSVSLDGQTVSIPVPVPEAVRILSAPAPEVRESQAVKNIVTKFADSLPEGKTKDKLLDAWYYMSVPREQQFEDARQYIGTYGFDNTLNAFLGGNIKSSLPLQGAIGFELAKGLGEKAKTDRFAREQLAEVMLLLSKKYGTEPRRTVDLWNALGELSANPEAMKMYVGKQIDSAIKDRLVAYKPEENEIASGLVDAGRRAAEKITTSKKMQKTLDQLGKLVDLNKKGGTVSQIQAVLADYLASEDANKDGTEFLGADLTAAPEVGGSEADDIRLDPKQTRALGRIILELIQRSENPRETAASADEIKRLVMLVPALRDAKNQDNVRRKIELYFDASLTYALESYGARALRAARARETGVEEEVVAPPATRGEAIERAARAKARAAQEAPVVIPSDAPSKLAELAEASADALQKQAARLQQEPKVKDALEEFAARIRRLIAQRTKEMGGLQPAFEPEPKPSEAEVLKDRIAKYPEVQEFISNVRDSLRNNYKEEDLIGLEPFIEEAFGRPFAVSSLKQAVRSLESIGGPQTNIRSLIRSSRGDIMDFENKMGALLTQNTNLDEAQKKEVLDFLRDGMTELISEERKKELENIKKKFEKKKERKTRKMRSALDKLIEATNLGVLTDSEVFMQMRSQLGLPELAEAERNKLNKMIEDLPLYPVGMIRNRKISEMYQYIKLVSPQVWGELLVNYQTSNLLAGVGTIGINAWSATASNQLNAAILGSIGFVKGMAGDKARSKAYIDAAKALNSAILIGDKQALKAAANIFFKGDYSAVQDALTQELGGVNIWEAIVSQAEAYRANKPGAVKPELPVNILGEEYRIPLDSKFISSKYGALAPFIFFGRSMAAGDAINKISSKKMYEIAEATNIAIEKGLKSQEEIELEVARLLNQSPEARARAEAKAAAEATEFNLTPDQESLRVEEILEQGRPDEEEVKNLAERAKTFAAQSTYTNNFEGWFGLMADGLTAISAKAWPLRLFIKFLKTGSSLANEVLNFMPVTSTVRLYRGSAAMLKDTKYYRPPAVPGTVEHDLLVGKMTLGYILTATLIYGLKEAMSGEDDPYFMIHFKGPNDPVQREAFFAAGGKLRSIQVGRFKDGSPQFFSFEGFPVGISGPLILASAIAESVRYDKRSKSEAIINGAIAGGALAMYGIMDMAALSGIRQIMSLTSPGPGTKDAKGIMTNLTKTFGNVVGGLIPGYATLRDVEQVWNGFTGAPSARPYQNNFLSTFALSVPFASKIGDPDLDFLGGNVRTQLANTVPFVRRLTTSGVDSVSYDEGKRTPQAIHDKLISMFASNRFSLNWDAGTLKDFAMQELISQKEANKEPITYDDFYQLKRELTTDERYEWMKRSGPIIQQQLGALIPQLENMSRSEFMTVVPQIVNPIKKAILYQVLLEKNQEGILFPERK